MQTEDWKHEHLIRAPKKPKPGPTRQSILEKAAKRRAQVKKLALRRLSAREISKIAELDIKTVYKDLDAIGLKAVR